MLVRASPTQQPPRRTCCFGDSGRTCSRCEVRCIMITSSALTIAPCRRKALNPGTGALSALSLVAAAGFGFACGVGVGRAP
eukprot:6621928-Prymnesium_polylepis.1